jgi:DNA topoisomerase-1
MSVKRCAIDGDRTRMGIRRIGKSSFETHRGKAISPKDRERILTLGIPPAWKDVWISAESSCHMQAVGTDARGRAQYRYHPDWTAGSSTIKFRRLSKFMQQLPSILNSARKDARITQRGSETRESDSAPSAKRTCSNMVLLLNRTHMRIGNDEYARDNQSYGMTTLEKRHVHKQRDGSYKLEFQGKSGVLHKYAIRDKGAVRFLNTMLALPGKRLFQCVSGKDCRSVKSTDINAYLQTCTKKEETFTAKDFRTYHANMLLADEFQKMRFTPMETAKARNAVIKGAIHIVAERLHHTPAVCRKSYLCPALIKMFSEKPHLFSSGSRGAIVRKAVNACV